MALDFIEVKDANGVTHEIAVDKIGTRNYQFIKMAFGADDAVVIASDVNPVPVSVLSGSTSGVEYATGTIVATPTGKMIMFHGGGNVATAVSATNPLPITMAAGSSLELTGEIEIGADAAVLQVTPTINTTQYSVNDTIGGLLTLPNAFRAPAGTTGGSAVIQSISIMDKANQKAAIDFHFFSSSATIQANNNGFTWNTADFVKWEGVVSFPAATYSTLDNRGVGSLFPVGLVIYGNSTQNLFVSAVSKGTPTYTSTTDLHFNFGLLRD